MGVAYVTGSVQLFSLTHDWALHALPICTATQVHFAIACRVLIPSLIFIHERKCQFASVICTTLTLLYTILHMLTAPCPTSFTLFPAIIRQIIRPGALVLVLQGGSNMTGTDLCVNKPHCAAAVRP